jgi:hypothetical protein
MGYLGCYRGTGNQIRILPVGCLVLLSKTQGEPKLVFEQTRCVFFPAPTTLLERTVA